MAEFIVLMKGAGQSIAGDWVTYIETLRKSGLFRGGSSLGNGVSIANKVDSGEPVVTGFMRFEADSINDVRVLLEGNPLYEAGGDIELLELIKD